MNKFVDVFFYAFVVAGLLVLTRPGSLGSRFMREFGNAMIGLVQAASGQKVAR